MNLAYSLVKKYENMPNKICLIEKNTSVDFSKLYKKVSCFSNYLRNQGIKKESNVLVLVPMSINLYVTLLSLWSIGATACFMDAGFIRSGMKRNKFEEIDCVIGITKYLLYANINKNLKKIKKINVNEIKEIDKKLEIEDLENDFPAILTYTSGTTRNS